MLIVTAKMPKRKLTLGVAAAALLCCCAIALNFGHALSREVSGSALPSPRGVKSNQDRIDYLSAYGWQVGKISMKGRTVRFEKKEETPA